MDSQFYAVTHTDKTTHIRLQGHSYFTKALHFLQTLTITFLFREVPVKLLLRLLQVFFLHIHLRQNKQETMFSTIFQ